MPAFHPRDTPRAQALRNTATPAERALWTHLQRSQIGGHKFSRQIPVGPYFADFVCRRSKLVVEVDGYSHDVAPESDARRTAFLERAGYRVIRFMNEDVLHNPEGVIAAISAALQDMPTPNPSRKREGK